MEGIVRDLFSLASLALEGVACVVLLIGALGAVFGVGKELLWSQGYAWRRQLWLRFAAWIVLSLEFSLAADIVDSLHSPSWDELGKLAVVATLRTVLGLFVWRDLHEVENVKVNERSAPLN